LTPRTVVVDASVVIPWIHQEQEPFAAECLKVYRDFVAGQVQVVVPQILFYELSNFAAMRGRKGSFPLEQLSGLLNLDFSVHQLKPVDFVEVARLADEKKITAYDAAYLYVASVLDAPLLTVDGPLIGAWGLKPGGHVRNYDRLKLN
jgi:predicted nucleic acid-binding protein